MKTLIITLFLIIISYLQSFAQDLDKMQFIHGPEDGLIYSYDYNPVCGISVAVVVSEFIPDPNNMSSWIPSIISLQIKKDDESNWITVFFNNTNDRNNIRSDAIVHVFDNGVIRARSKYRVWDGTKYVEYQWLAYTLDLGKHWWKSYDNGNVGHDFFSVGQTLYNVNNDLLYLSYDFGKTWYNNHLPNNFHDFGYFRKYNFINVSESGVTFIQSQHDFFYGSNKDSVYSYKSTDCISWTSTGMQWHELLNEMLVKNVNEYFAISDSTGLFYSNDQAITFNRIALLDKKIKFIKFSDNSHNQIYAAGNNEAYLINTNNFNVIKLNVPGGNIVGIGSKDNNLFLSLSHGVIAESTDNGITWNNIKPPTFPLSYQKLLVDKEDIIYVNTSGIYGYKDHRLYRSSDFGTNWELLDKNDHSEFNIFKVFNKVVFNNPIEKKLYIFDKDKRLFFDYYKYSYVSSIHQLGDSTLYIVVHDSTLNNIYLKSNDLGMNWSQNYSPNIPFYIQYFVNDNNDTYYMSSTKYLLYDKNLDLKNQYNIPNFLTITDQKMERDGLHSYTRKSKSILLIDKNRKPVILEGDVTPVDKKCYNYTTPDSGLSWQKHNLPFSPNIDTKYLIQNKNNDIYYIFNDGLYKFNIQINQVEKTADYPDNFLKNDTITLGLAYDNLTHDDDSSGSIFCLLPYYGILYYSSTGNNSIIPIKDSLTLISAYPNPASDQVTLKFPINEDNTSVSVKIYDYIGNEALDLGSATLNKGNFQANLNTGKLPNGFYFIVIKINNKLIAVSLFIHH